MIFVIDISYPPLLSNNILRVCLKFLLTQGRLKLSSALPLSWSSGITGMSHHKQLQNKTLEGP